MEDGGWKMEDGGWRMEDGGWKMEDGKWRMEDGGWRMEDGGWRMEDGGWRTALPTLARRYLLSSNLDPLLPPYCNPSPIRTRSSWRRRSDAVKIVSENFR
jgi:hypothetical protein